MSLTIVLSGPKTSTTQARNALAGAGLGVQPTEHDHGLPPLATGEEIREAQGFVTVHGDDVDRAHAAVQSLGWRLRLHYHTPEPARPSLESMLLARLDALEAEVKALRAGNLPPIGGAAVESPPGFLQAGSYAAEITRRAIGSLLARGASVGSITGGLVGSGDCALSPPGSGMSVTVAPGEVWVPGSTSATQSGYYCRVSSSTSLSIAASDPTNPRIDTVVAQVQDAAYSGSNNTFQVAVVTGTPTAGATLSNLNGKGAVPASSYVLGYVLVPANATSIVSADLLSVATPYLLQSNSASAGAVIISAAQSVTSTTYTTMTTPDQVSGIVVPANSLMRIWYQAAWQESVAQAGSAAIFIGTNQLQIAGETGPGAQSALTNSSTAALYLPLSTSPIGLISRKVLGSDSYGSDATTGQVFGMGVFGPGVAESDPTGSGGLTTNVAGTGGACEVFVAPGTYAVSVQFKSTSGSVTAKNRQLWVQVVNFNG